MAFPTPSDLLFQALRPPAEPLFSSQSELTRKLMKIPGSDFGKQKFESLRALVNQVLKPANDKNSRPLSEDMRDSMLYLVESRLEREGDVDAEAFKESLLKAFENLKNPENFDPEALAYEARFTELMASLKDAARIVFCNVDLFLISPAHQAKALTDVLLTLLGLRGGQGANQDTQISFFISRSEAALWFRNNFRQAVRKAARKAEEAIPMLEEEKRLRLPGKERVPPFLPRCALQPRHGPWQSFLLFGGERFLEIHPVPDEHTRDWVYTFLTPFFNNDDSGLFETPEHPARGTSTAT